MKMREVITVGFEAAGAALLTTAAGVAFGVAAACAAAGALLLAAGLYAEFG
jgi:hypothetical protein